MHFICNIFSYLFITCDCFSGHLWMFKMDVAEITGSSLKTSVYLALKQPVTARTSFNWYANFGSHPFRPTDCKTQSLRSPPAHCWCWKNICSETLCTETDFFCTISINMQKPVFNGPEPLARAAAVPAQLGLVMACLQGWILILSAEILSDPCGGRCRPFS